MPTLQKNVIDTEQQISDITQQLLNMNSIWYEERNEISSPLAYEPCVFYL